MEEFRRLTRLPAYVFNITGALKADARKRGEDIIDFGMGNPDGATPKHIVDKLIEAAQKTTTHRYSLSRGVPRLRKAICDWYQRRYAVTLDPETEAIVTIGSKEGIAHLCLAMLDHEDTVAVPNPSYPIHIYGPVIAGSRIQSIALDDTNEATLLETLERELPRMNPRPKLLILNFPANPTTQCVELSFFQRLVPLCKDLGIYIIHDLAYADLVFDGYRAPSILEVPGAKEIAVEFFTLSKSYNMPGWRVGFMVGCPKLVAALGRIKSYFDYGTYPGRIHRRARRPAAVRCRHRCQLQVAPRRTCLRHEQAGLAGGTAQGHNVRLGQNSRAVPRPGLARFLQEAADRRQDRRQPRHRLRRSRRQLRPLRPHRERRAHPPGPPRHEADVQGRIDPFLAPLRASNIVVPLLFGLSKVFAVVTACFGNCLQASRRFSYRSWLDCIKKGGAGDRCTLVWCELRMGNGRLSTFKEA
jgi:histidinol-phosphate/aromatic aminotransferase/cobyric acid decarboxylase-like protein